MSRARAARYATLARTAPVPAAPAPAAPASSRVHATPTALPREER